jgi:Protein of unknown function (DUF2829)
MKKNCLFNEVLVKIKSGNKARRPYWGPAWLDFVQTKEGPIMSYIRITNGERSFVWRPTQEDILAEDWRILNDVESFVINVRLWHTARQTHRSDG